MYKSYHYNNMPQPVAPKPENSAPRPRPEQEKKMNETAISCDERSVTESKRNTFIGNLKNDDIILLVVVFILLMDECDDKLLLIMLGFIFFSDFFA